MQNVPLIMLAALLACGGRDTPAVGPCGGGCSIGLEHVVTLTDRAEPGSIGVGRSLGVQQDVHGRFLLPALTGDRVLVFDGAGELVAQVGRRGRGPGEFQRAFGILPFGDSVLVWDMAQRRATVLGPELQPSRVVMAPFEPVLAIGSDTVLSASARAAGSHEGQPLHLTRLDGTRIRSLGADLPLGGSVPLVAPARDGTVWIAAPSEYSIERWDPRSGERLARIDVASSWFRGAARPQEVHERPLPTLQAVWQDAEGVLWLLTRVADADWQAPPADGPELVLHPATLSRLYDWILEAVDADSGRVLAARRFTDYVDVRPPSRLLVSLRAETDSTTELDVWRPTLRP